MSVINAVSTATVELRSLQKKWLSSDLIQKIATYFDLQDWGRFSHVTKEIHTLLNSEESTREICPMLYREFEKLYPNVINLDKLGARRLLDLPEYKQPESIKSLKDHMSFLREAGLLAELSEDGKAVIVTLPKDWTIEKAEAISQAAVDAGIASAGIRYGSPLHRTALQNNPIKKAQRVAISNTVIKESRDQSIANRQALLRAKGLEGEFPDALIVITVAVLARILTDGSSYSLPLSQGVWSYTHTNKKISEDWILCVGTTSSYVHVCSAPSDSGEIGGVGALRKFEILDWDYFLRTSFAVTST